jgi:hypothetical protein
MSSDLGRERRRHFRGRGGAGRRVDLRYRPLTGGDRAWRTAPTDDVGIGGAYVLTAEPLPIGALLEVEIWPPGSDEAIVVRGEVRWVERGDARGGMGVAFGTLTTASMLALSDYFATFGTAEPGEA